jgi:N-acetylmuramoyl-L-alanine amidase
MVLKLVTVKDLMIIALRVLFKQNEIQKQLVSLVGIFDRGVEEEEWYVIKNQDVPSVLVELGFVTNAADSSKLASSTSKNLYAEAVYRGVIFIQNRI